MFISPYGGWRKTLPNNTAGVPPVYRFGACYGKSKLEETRRTTLINVNPQLRLGVFYSTPSGVGHTISTAICPNMPMASIAIKATTTQNIVCAVLRRR